MAAQVPPTPLELPSPPAWPHIPEGYAEDAAMQLKLFESKLQEVLTARTDLAKLERDEIAALIPTSAEVSKTNWDSQHVMIQAINAAYLEVGKTTAADPNARATFVMTAAGAIGTIYTGLLALVYGVGQHAETLPSRGLWAGVFLALAVVFAAVYYAFVTVPAPSPSVDLTGGWYEIVEQQRNAFLEWTRARSLRRRAFIQAAVLSLGLALAFLPAAFLDLQDSDLLIAAALGLLVVIGVPMALRQRDQ